MKVRPYDPLKPFSLKFNWGEGDLQLIKTDEDGKAVADVEFLHKLNQKTVMENIHKKTSHKIYLNIISLSLNKVKKYLAI